MRSGASCRYTRCQRSLVQYYNELLGERKNKMRDASLAVRHKGDSISRGA